MLSSLPRAIITTALSILITASQVTKVTAAKPNYTANSNSVSADYDYFKVSGKNGNGHVRQKCLGGITRCNDIKIALERRKKRIQENCKQNPKHCEKKRKNWQQKRLNAIRFCNRKPELCLQGEHSLAERREKLNRYISSNDVLKVKKRK